MRSGTLSLTKLLAVLLGGLLLLVSPIGCSDDPADPEDTGDTDSGEIHTDEGYIGMVIDTRPIFRKGYLPTMAQLDFADYDDFDVELPIDPITNLAILNLHNEDLTEGLRTAFGAGVAATLTITDETRAVLATVTYSGLVLDDRNFTWSITTELPLITKPVALRSVICPIWFRSPATTTSWASRRTATSTAMRSTITTVRPSASTSDR